MYTGADEGKGHEEKAVKTKKKITTQTKI